MLESRPSETRAPKKLTHLRTKRHVLPGIFSHFYQYSDVTKFPQGLLGLVLKSTPRPSCTKKNCTQLYSWSSDPNATENSFFGPSSVHFVPSPSTPAQTVQLRRCGDWYPSCCWARLCPCHTVSRAAGRRFSSARRARSRCWTTASDSTTRRAASGALLRRRAPEHPYSASKTMLNSGGSLSLEFAC